MTYEILQFAVKLWMLIESVMNAKAASAFKTSKGQFVSAVAILFF